MLTCLQTGELLHVYNGHSSAITSIAILDKLMTTASLDKLVRVYDLEVCSIFLPYSRGDFKNIHHISPYIFRDVSFTPEPGGVALYHSVPYLSILESCGTV